MLDKDRLGYDFSGDDRRYQHEYPPKRGEQNMWEFTHPNTGKVEYVRWDIESLLADRMHGGGVLQNAAWAKCLKRYATNVSLYKLNLIKKSPEWLDAIFSFIRENRIVFRSRRRAEKIFGVPTEDARKIVGVSMDVLKQAYKEGKETQLVNPNWNDHYQ